jgi:hypothetical protein
MTAKKNGAPIAVSSNGAPIRAELKWRADSR